MMKNPETNIKRRRRLESGTRMIPAKQAPCSVRRIPIWISGEVEWPAFIIFSRERNSSG
jgi:hypothetical protein